MGDVAITADGWCVICAAPVAYFGAMGWSHITQKGLRVVRDHKPVPDRSVRER